MPPEIESLLTHPGFHVAIRVVLTSFFWIAGLFGLLNFRLMVGLIRSHGLPAAPLVVCLMIATELLGSLLLITDLRSLGWLGACALAVFTLLSIPLGHAFWRFEPPKRMEEFQIALEHIGMVGGLACAAVLTAYR